MRDYIFILIIAAAVTYLLTPLVRTFALRIKAYREPNARDVHTEPTPLIGGLAMYGGMVAALLVAQRLSYLQQAFPSSRTVDGLLAAGGLLVIIGIVDDRFGLSAMSKAAGQVAAGGILVWSGAALPWLPLPNGGEFVLEPDLSYTLTILLVVVTINAVNFIDGLDGLAAGVVGIAGLSFFIYSYTLTNSLKLQSQSVPAVASAVLFGMCAGFLPHNFHPARVFMGDTGAMLIGLMLAYGPISSTFSLDPSVLTNYAHSNTLNRFPTILPILLPVAILIIPYTDLLLAVIRRTARGDSPFAPDRKHLHHRLLNMGHSHRQSVLLMYLWAALFSGAVVGLSVVRTGLAWLGIVTLAALVALLLATIPQWRPWHKRVGEVRLAEPAPALSRQPATPPPIIQNDSGFPAKAAPTASAGYASGPGGYPMAPNGMGPHGMGPHGVAPNGMAPHGMGPHGVAPYGMGPHGVAPNGMAPNGVAPADGLPPTGDPAGKWSFRDLHVQPRSHRK
jgi:UDP-GlcNAc:undecaprenyl-phosphate/decaprenyl-phosphate GlcNAc-1-phosphate transferase